VYAIAFIGFFVWDRRSSDQSEQRFRLLETQLQGRRPNVG
jgi:hypothetical protein